MKFINFKNSDQPNYFIKIEDINCFFISGGGSLPIKFGINVETIHQLSHFSYEDVLLLDSDFRLLIKESNND